jgi:hypothetical protein
VAVHFGATLFGVELTRLALFPKITLIAGNFVSQGREIFQRMKLCLVGQAQTRSFHVRHRLLEGSVKTELVREPRIFTKVRRIIVASRSFQGLMEVSGNARELTFDVFAPDIFFDLVDRRRARVPNGLRVIASEIFHELVQARVGYGGEMSGSMAGVNAPNPGAFCQRHAQAIPPQQVCGRDARDSAAEHQDIDCDWFFNWREALPFNRGQPIRRRIHRL